MNLINCDDKFSRSTSSELVRTSRRRECFGSTVDFYSQSALTHNMLESKLKL